MQQEQHIHRHQHIQRKRKGEKEKKFNSILIKESTFALVKLASRWMKNEIEIIFFFKVAETFMNAVSVKWKSIQMLVLCVKVVDETSWSSHQQLRQSSTTRS